MKQIQTYQTLQPWHPLSIKHFKKFQWGQGRPATVDDCDCELNKFKWYYLLKSQSSLSRRCVCRVVGRRLRLLSREVAKRAGVIGDINDMVVEHINGNILDNRRSNLKVTYKGISKCVDISEGWWAEIDIHGEWLNLGVFDSYDDAVEVYNASAMRNKLPVIT